MSAMVVLAPMLTPSSVSVTPSNPGIRARLTRRSGEATPSLISSSKSVPPATGWAPSEESERSPTASSTVWASTYSKGCNSYFLIDLSWYLVLQFPLSSQAATAMACLGYLLVPTPPAGPANDLRWRVSRDPQEADQESTDLRDSERDVLWAGQRPLLAAPTARATRVRVIWRYQPCQLRTS